MVIYTNSNSSRRNNIWGEGGRGIFSNQKLIDETIGSLATFIYLGEEYFVERACIGYIREGEGKRNRIRSCYRYVWKGEGQG